MTAFEIAITVIFGILTLWISALCYQIIFLLEKKIIRDNEKKPASKDEADKENSDEVQE